MLGTTLCCVLTDSEPVISLQSPVAVIQGQNVTFSCSFNYTYPYTLATVVPSMFWSLNGARQSQTYPNVTSSSITVPATGTVIPPYTCNVGFTITWSPTIANVAKNYAIKGFNSAPILVQCKQTRTTITNIIVVIIQ